MRRRAGRDNQDVPDRPWPLAPPGPRPRSVAAICARYLLDAAAAAGLDRAKLPCVAVPDEGAFEATVSYDTQLDPWEALGRATDDPRFPVFVGSRLQPREHDVVGFAYMTRKNLGRR